MFDELPVIALCGSMRFRDEFERLEAELMLARIVVGSRTILSPSGPLDAAQRERLGGAQLQKVAMADEILVVNVDSYIGDSTLGEIEYARSRGVAVRFLERRSDGCWLHVRREAMAAPGCVAGAREGFLRVICPR